MISFRPKANTPGSWELWLGKFINTKIVFNNPTAEELLSMNGIDIEAENQLAAYDQLCEMFELDPKTSKVLKLEIVVAIQDATKG